MGELRGNFWEVNVTKWKKLPLFMEGSGEKSIADFGMQIAEFEISHLFKIENLVLRANI